MAIWAAILARQDLKGEKTGRLMIYMVGMVLTFNLGRDITPITLCPFLFGFIMLVVWSRAKGEVGASAFALRGYGVTGPPHFALRGYGHWSLDARHTVGGSYRGQMT